MTVCTKSLVNLPTYTGSLCDLSAKTGNEPEYLVTILNVITITQEL